MLSAIDFYEAVQSIRFAFAFIMLCGNWSWFGRINLLLGDYLEADLKSVGITLDESDEIPAHLFIKAVSGYAAVTMAAEKHGIIKILYYDDIIDKPTVSK